MATTNLWMIWSAEKGYHTAKGWAHSPRFAHLFSRESADTFIAEKSSKDPNAFLLAIHYDARVAHTDVRILGQMPDKTTAPDMHLHRLAQHTINAMTRKDPIEFTRKFDLSLQRFDRVLDAFRDRRRAHEWQKAVPS